MKSLSRVQLCATPQTAAHQAPPSMGFPRQEYWSGVPLPSPREAPMYCQNHEQVHCFSLHTPLTSYFPSLLIKRRNGVFPGDPVVMNLPCNVRDTGSAPGLGTKISHTKPEHSGARLLQLLKPACSRACAPQENPLQ